MQKAEITFDNHLLIGQRFTYKGSTYIEGGDSASWTGLYTYLTGDRDTGFPTLEVAPGAYARHPVPHPISNRFGYYYAGTWDGVISRDQLTGIILGHMKLENRAKTWDMIKHHARRGFLFSYNSRKNGLLPEEAPWKLPDFTGPDIWALYLRSFGAWSWIAFPVLCVLDLQMLINAVNIRYVKKEKEHVLNFLGKFFASREYVPTPVSWVTKLLVSKTQMHSALKLYWDGWRQNPGMSKLFSKKVDELV